MQNEQPTAPAPTPVVPSMQLPKITMPQKSLAGLNAFSIAIATFFGALSIFGAIAKFVAMGAKSGDGWAFGIPITGVFNNTAVPALFITAFIALVFGVIGFITLRKITDAEVLQKSYGKTSGFFTILSIIFTSITISVVFYALFALGEKSGVVQKDLWLNSFLPSLIVSATAIVTTVLAKQVAAGKTALLRIFGFIALGVAAIGFILVVISTLVGFYGKTSSSPYDYNDIYNLFNY
ncbi:MAG: hypothetical protein LBQ02_01445 [Candidatus Nomurabacteria bacterium]|jgi:MFS family permease|nr:hypothetical protein [Candidatus Nomurabacteria bacterium]